MRHKGFSQALERLEQRDDYPYGTGYRRLKKAYRGNLRSLLPHSATQGHPLFCYTIRPSLDF